MSSPAVALVPQPSVSLCFVVQRPAGISKICVQVVFAPLFVRVLCAGGVLHSLVCYMSPIAVDVGTVCIDTAIHGPSHYSDVEVVCDRFQYRLYFP